MDQTTVSKKWTDQTLGILTAIRLLDQTKLPGPEVCPGVYKTLFTVLICESHVTKFNRRANIKYLNRFNIKSRASYLSTYFGRKKTQFTLKFENSS